MAQPSLSQCATRFSPSRLPPSRFCTPLAAALCFVVEGSNAVCVCSMDLIWGLNLCSVFLPFLNCAAFPLWKVDTLLVPVSNRLSHSTPGFVSWVQDEAFRIGMRQWCVPSYQQGGSNGTAHFFLSCLPPNKQLSVHLPSAVIDSNGRISALSISVSKINASCCITCFLALFRQLFDHHISGF